MTIGAMHPGLFPAEEATARTPRELAAIANAAEWINSPRLTVSALAGKVVLVDFWTYTCINWLRTLPYLRAWTQKYTQLAIIGVYTPEFPFERDVENVRRAVRRIAFNGCWPKPEHQPLATAPGSMRAAWKRRRTGTTCDRGKPPSGTSGPRTSHRAAVSNSTGDASTLPRRACRSINGR